MACVRIEGENTEDFEVKTDLRKDCFLSPTLFNITLDYIMTRARTSTVHHADDGALLLLRQNPKGCPPSTRRQDTWVFIYHGLIPTFLNVGHSGACQTLSGVHSVN